jgi:hypothetical protein
MMFSLLLALAVPAIAGIEEKTTVPISPGGTIEYTESIVVTYRKLAVPPARITLSPEAAHAPLGVKTTCCGSSVTFRWRKTPGVTYTLHVDPATAVDGTQYGSEDFTVGAPPVVVPTPVPITLRSPYLFGTGAGAAGIANGGLIVGCPKRCAADPLQVDAVARQLNGQGYVRTNYSGSQIEPKSSDPLQAQWGQTSLIASAFGARGIDTLALIVQYNAPAWASGGLPGNGGVGYIWGSPRDYAAYCGTVASHVAADSLLARFVREIEPMNEPNTAAYWRNPNISGAYQAQDGSAAARYLLPCYSAIKAADPALVVVGPSLQVGSGGQLDARNFLTKMYANGCRQGTCWDVLSVHPYFFVNPSYNAGSNCQNFGLGGPYPCVQARPLVYQDLQHIAVLEGDPVPKVAVTEFNFGTCTKLYYCQDPAVAALYLTQTYNLWLSDPTVVTTNWTNVVLPYTRQTTDSSVYLSSVTWDYSSARHTATPYQTLNQAFAAFTAAQPRLAPSNAYPARRKRAAPYAARRR